MIRRNAIKAILCCFVLMFGISAAGMTASADFVKTKDGVKYELDGAYLKSCFYKTGGNTYYFDKKGVMKTGWLTAKNGTYYFDKKGRMQTGLTSVKNSDGTVSRYYFDSDGKMVKNDRVDYKLITYHIGKDGIVEKIVDHSKMMYIDLDDLYEQKQTNESYLKAYKTQQKPYKDEQDFFQKMMWKAEDELNSLLEKKKLYDDDDVPVYLAHEIADTKRWYNFYYLNYEYYTSIVNEIGLKISRCENDISDADIRIKRIEKQLKDAGYSIKRS